MTERVVVRFLVSVYNILDMFKTFTFPFYFLKRNILGDNYLGDNCGDSDGVVVIKITMMVLAMTERVVVRFLVSVYNILDMFKTFTFPFYFLKRNILS